MSNLRPIKHQITITTPRGDKTPTIAWLPFVGATFAAQRTLASSGTHDWRVVHVATTRLLPYPCPDFRTRTDALVVANRLSLECPSAAHLALDDAGEIVGPIATLAEEFRASLRFDGAAA